MGAFANRAAIPPAASPAFSETLANAVHGDATAWTGFSRDVDHDVFARQMIGQRLALRPHSPGLRSGSGLVDLVGLSASNICFQVFQTDGELIRIESLRATAELRSLQLFDDGPKPLDLAVAMLDGDGHIADQMLQKRRFGRQIIKIEPHARIYPNRLI
jgi:hypothetical protein